METAVNQYLEKPGNNLQKFNILYVDNEETARRSFRNDFCKSYFLFIAGSGSEGLRILEEIEIHLVIIDSDLTDMCSIKFLQEAVQINPGIVKIMLASTKDADHVIRVVNAVKIDKYLSKPWDKTELEKIINKELAGFGSDEHFVKSDFPHLNFQSRIGDEILSEKCEVGDQLSTVFKNSFEIKNYPLENYSNFQWVGRSVQGHKVVILLNMTHPTNGQQEIKKCMSEFLDRNIRNNPDTWNEGILDQVNKCYRDHVQEPNGLGEIRELNTCVLTIHDINDTVRYFTNYDGLKLFDLSLNEMNISNSGSCKKSELNRAFIYSTSFNDYCLGDLTYSQLINESIEMDLERQGHFLEIEILNSPLIAKNVSIVGIELSQNSFYCTS